MEEVWKPVINFEQYYAVSNLGRVKSLGRIIWNGRVFPERILRQTKDFDGYLQVGFSVDGKRTTPKVAILVCAAFHGIRPSGKVVCHNDGNKINNYATNLRWDTPEGNEKDKEKHDTLMRGTKNGRAILNEADVFSIKNSTMTYGQLSQLYGVHKTTIYDIKRKRSWRHLDGFAA